MRVARASVEGHHRVLLARTDGPWHVLSGPPGDDPADTAALVETWPAVLAAFTAGQVRPVDLDESTLLCPLVRPGKVLAIGLNYLDHIEETGLATPDRPLLFAKFLNTLAGPYDDVEIDERLTEQGDYEVELAAVIGRRVRRLPEAQGLDAVFGYTVANDISARDAQFSDGQFDRSKSFDGFLPMGPWLTTRDEVSDPQALALRCRVKDEVRQDSSTKQMLFPVAHLVHYLSLGMTLEPGDVLLTGTPSGVGHGRRPPSYLRPGDVVECEVEGLGAIANTIVPSTVSPAPT